MTLLNSPSVLTVTHLRNRCLLYRRRMSSSYFLCSVAGKLTINLLSFSACCAGNIVCAYTALLCSSASIFAVSLRSTSAAASSENANLLASVACRSSARFFHFPWMIAISLSRASSRDALMLASLIAFSSVNSVAISWNNFVLPLLVRCVGLICFRSKRTTSSLPAVIAVSTSADA